MMANSLPDQDYSLSAQHYRLLAKRLRDKAANFCSQEMRSELESMARVYELRADRAENSLRQSTSLGSDNSVGQSRFRMRRKRKRIEELWVKVQRLNEAVLGAVTKLALTKGEQRWLRRRHPRRKPTAHVS
jgi:hypothetical protein